MQQVVSQIAWLTLVTWKGLNNRAYNGKPKENSDQPLCTFFLEMILSTLGLMYFATASFNSETRCWCVRRDLCGMFSFITEDTCWQDIDRMRAAWRPSCGIDSGSRGANSAALNVLGTDDHCIAIQWVPTASAQCCGVNWKWICDWRSRFNFCGSKSANLLLIPPWVWSVGQRRIWPSQRRSLIWDALIESHISVISCFRPCSITFRVLRRSATFRPQAWGGPLVWFPWNDQSNLNVGFMKSSQHFPPPTQLARVVSVWSIHRVFPPLKGLWIAGDSSPVNK